MTDTSLHDAIVSAFAGNSYPGDDQLTVCDLAGRDYDETFQLLRGKSWREMPVVEFMFGEGDTAIPELTPEAFHYFMPALLLTSLDEGVQWNSDIAHSLSFYLSPSSARHTGEFAYDNTEEYNRLMSLFTNDQRAVLIRVLEEYVAREWEFADNIQATVELLRSNMDNGVR